MVIVTSIAAKMIPRYGTYLRINICLCVCAREAVHGLISQANRATKFLQERGPALISELSEQFAGEMVGLIDEYVDRVNSKIRHEVRYYCKNSTYLPVPTYCGSGTIFSNQFRCS